MDTGQRVQTIVASKGGAAARAHLASWEVDLYQTWPAGVAPGAGVSTKCWGRGPSVRGSRASTLKTVDNGFCVPAKDVTSVALRFVVAN
jgi:hypothetical protein